MSSQSQAPDDPVAQGRDRETIAALAQRFGAALHVYFRRRLPGQPDIDDLVQEVFFRLVRRGGIDDIENVDGFVFSMAANVIKDHYKRRTRSGADLHQPLEENHEEESAFSPERVLQAKQALNQVRTAIADLPMRTRHAFILCTLHGYTHDQAADELGMSARNLRNHLKRAFEILDARRRENG